jgi:cold shock CspA family protein
MKRINFTRSLDMNHSTLPRTITCEGRYLNASGKGRMPGSQVYIDHGSGEILELFLATVVQTGPHFSKVVVPENTHFGTLTLQAKSVQNGPLELGQACFIQLDLRGTTSVKRAWGIGRAPRRKTGRIFEVTTRGFGFICPDGGGDRVFVHLAECTPPSLLAVGAAVSYDQRKNDRGYYAVNVTNAR